MQEIYDIVTAVNRLKDKTKELSDKIDYLSKSPSQQLTAKYLDNDAACKILHLSYRTLYNMRADGTLPYIKIRRRILYKASDLHAYLENNSRRHC